MSAYIQQRTMRTVLRPVFFVLQICTCEWMQCSQSQQHSVLLLQFVQLAKTKACTEMRGGAYPQDMVARVGLNLRYLAAERVSGCHHRTRPPNSAKAPVSRDCVASERCFATLPVVDLNGVPRHLSNVQTGRQITSRCHNKT